MTADLFYTGHLTPDEKERLYWSAGLHELAAVYAYVADADEAYTELEEKSADPDDLLEAQKEVERLTAQLVTATEQLDALYESVDDAPKLNRKKILEVLGKVDTYPPNAQKYERRGA